MQWADVATRDLLRYTIRRWTDSRTPILIILVVRSEDLDTDMGLTQWLNALERDTPTLHLPLETLGRDDLVAFLTRLAGPSNLIDDERQAHTVTEFATWLASRTGGHPLSLTHAVQTLLQEGVLHVLPTGDGNWAIDVPHVRNMEHISGLDGGSFAGASTGTPTLAGTFARSRERAAPRSRIVYPMAATHSTHCLVRAG
jgi:predicted ATPase